LYSCIESARLWYDNLKIILEKFGFIANPYDICVFNKNVKDGEQVTLCIHVDDMLITAPSKTDITNLIDELKQIYGELTVNMGIKINYLGMVFDFSTNG
jgi:hypothetical protein